MHARHRFEGPWDENNRPGAGIRPERLLFEAALRGRGRGRGRGHPGAGFGRHGGMGGFGGPMFGRGPKVGRGDVRAAILALLSEKPMHGYQIITELTERSGGVWRPSPGSVYPTLQSLEDEGLIAADKSEGRRVFDLTVEGLKVANEAGDGPAPWRTRRKTPIARSSTCATWPSRWARRSCRWHKPGPPSRSPRSTGS